MAHNPYKYHKNLDKASIELRIEMFKETGAEMIAEGKSINDLKWAVNKFIEDESYEAAQGISEAIKEHEDKINKPKSAQRF